MQGIILNRKLKELMKKDIVNFTDREKEEFFNLIKDSSFFIPIELSGESGAEQLTPVMIGADTGEMITPLYTDEDEIRDRTMLTLQLDMLDIVNILEEANAQGVLIDPFSEFPLAITVSTLSQLYMPDFEMVVAELRGLLHQNSTTLSSDNELYLRSKEPLGEEFIPEIPVNVSSNREFRKELPYLNVLRMSKGDKIMYVGDIVDTNERPDVVIAPETVFRLVEENGNEFIWECRGQPFYD